MPDRFEATPTPLAGLVVIDRKPIPDSRGWFERFFCVDEWQALGLTRPIVQMNRTLTWQKGSVRGMHFQREPHLETKVVTCLRGEVWDVAVDLREDSPTYLQWHAEILSDNNHRALLIPDGFAHGFQTLKENCELLYLHTERFVPNAAEGLNPSDPRLSIQWPLPFAEISDKDRQQALIDADFRGLKIRAHSN